MEHEADHGEGDHGFGDFGQVLVILGQAPPATEPAEGSFTSPLIGGRAGSVQPIQQR